jgi:hypothetical protein
MTICASVAVAILLTLGIGSAEARRGGPSAAQIAAMKAKAKEQQEQAAALEAAKTKKSQEILNRYDLNKNGKIDGTEHPAWDKYWREVKLGKEPDPYSDLKIEKPTSTTAKKK